MPIGLIPEPSMFKDQGRITDGIIGKDRFPFDWSNLFISQMTW